MSELEELKARVKSLEDLMQALSRCFIAAPQKTEQPKPATQQSSMTSDEHRILNKFPEHLRQHLTIEQDSKVIRTAFVSKEYWEEMNDIAKASGYKWMRDVTTPKNSRWER